MLMSYNMGQQRRLSGNIGVQLGEYYNGTIQSLTFSQGRYAILKQFSVEPRMSITHIDLPTERVHDTAVRRAHRLRLQPAHVRERAAAIQLGRPHLQQQRAFSLGIPPGSEFFVVWTDEQDTNPLEPQRGNIALRNRALSIKMTRLFRF